MNIENSFKNLKGKKLLVLAGASVHCKVVKTAKELGIYTIVTDYLEPKYSPAKLIADEYWMLDIKDVVSIIQRCKEVKVDGVINFCIDPGQIPYQKICEGLGLPCIGTKEQFEILTDKRKFKDFCVSNNVDVIPEYSEDDINCDNVNYPVFIKPSICRGSRGQKICHNKEEALKAVSIAKEFSSDGTMICEKYMGRDHDIASAFFVVDGEPYMVKFGDRYLGLVEDNLDKQVMCTRLPSKFSDKFEVNVSERVKGMIKKLGIKFGPVFLQGFIDGDTIRYYDPALRMPGGDYDIILNKATGFSTVRSFIHFALTGDSKKTWGNPSTSYLLSGGIALLITISARSGKLNRVSGIKQLQNEPEIIYARQIIPEGEIIPNTGDIKQRIAAVGAYIRDAFKEKEIVKKIYDTYKAEDENGEDMIVSRYKM